MSRYADGILAAVESGKTAPPETRVRRGRPGPEEERRAALLLLTQAFVAGRCQRREIDTVLLATKSDLRDLIEAHATDAPLDAPVFTGWRADFLGDDLRRVLDGTLAVGLDADGWPGAAV